MREPRDVGGHGGLGESTCRRSASGSRPTQCRSHSCRAKLSRSRHRCVTSRWIVVNSKESFGQRLCQPRKYVSSKPSTSILANAGAPCSATSASRVVHGTSMALSHTCPSQPPAPSAAWMKSAEAVDTVGFAELICSVSLPEVAPHAEFHQRHIPIARVDGADRLGAQRLRFQRHHAHAKAAKTADAITHVGADVERERARTDEAAIKRIHHRIARRIAVIDVERTAERCKGGVGAQGQGNRSVHGTDVNNTQRHAGPCAGIHLSACSALAEHWIQATAAEMTTRR